MQKQEEEKKSTEPGGGLLSIRLFVRFSTTADVFQRYADYISWCPVYWLVPFGRQSYAMAQVHLDGYGMSEQYPLQESDPCPESHYKCPHWYCIPTYLLNNGEQDCLNGEDENIAWENFTCPGFYRCYKTMNCVHPRHVCDGLPHCPNLDDEMYCQLQCPRNCTCEGFAYTCSAMFDVYQHLHVRYLDLSGVFDPLLADAQLMEYLHFLNLSSCQLRNVTLRGLHHLRVLDLSRNFLTNLTSLTFQELFSLLHLNLSNNPLLPREDPGISTFLGSAGVAKLRTLNLVNTSLNHMGKGSLAALNELAELDVRSNPLESFHAEVFQGLYSLRLLSTDSSKLCCMLPTDTLARCRAPVDELSSCSDLLRSDFFRAFLWGLSLLAITGDRCSGCFCGSCRSWL